MCIKLVHCNVQCAFTCKCVIVYDKICRNVKKELSFTYKNVFTVHSLTRRSCTGLADNILGNSNSVKGLFCYITIGQKVLNDSCGHMIRLLAYPFPPSPSATCLSSSFLLCVAGRAYWRQRGEGWAKIQIRQIIRPRKSLDLYKSFNTLWNRPSAEF
jgi:hypothetical protein